MHINATCACCNFIFRSNMLATMLVFWSLHLCRINLLILVLNKLNLEHWRREPLDWWRCKWGHEEVHGGSRLISLVSSSALRWTVTKAGRRCAHAAGRCRPGREDRRTKAACRTPIPYRCQALDQAPHGPVYPCDTAFPLVAVCSAWRFVWIWEEKASSREMRRFMEP